MRVFIFQSAKDGDIVGFSNEHTGGNLPDEFAPWERIGNAALASGDALSGVGPADQVMEGIKREGFFLANSRGVHVRHLPLRFVH